MKKLFSAFLSLFGIMAATQSYPLTPNNQAFLPDFPPSFGRSKTRRIIPDGIRLKHRFWKNKKAKVRRTNRARMNQIRCNNNGFKKLAA